MALPMTKRARSEIERLHDEMNSLFGSVFGGMESPIYERRLWPSIDVADREDAVLVKAEVPGCQAEDIDISVHGNVLTISGEKKHKEEKEEKGFYHVESSYGKFRRELNLPTEVDISRIDAVCKDGILRITLPKAEQAKAMKVKVKSE